MEPLCNKAILNCKCICSSIWKYAYNTTLSRWIFHLHVHIQSSSFNLKCQNHGFLLFIIPRFHLSRIREYRKGSGSSVRLSCPEVRPCALLHVIWYTYKVPCVAHTCQIAYSSVPNLSNYGHFFIHLVCYLREKCVDCIHIWYSFQVPCVLMQVKQHLAPCQIWVIMAISSVCCDISEMKCDFVYLWYTYRVPCVAHAFKIACGSVPNLINYCQFFIHFGIWCDISEKHGLILFIFGIVIRNHVLLMHVKFHLALYQT